MIDIAIKMLALDEWKDISESVDIAKGKYELTEEDKKEVTIKSIFKWLKR